MQIRVRIHKTMRIRIRNISVKVLWRLASVLVPYVIVQYIIHGASIVMFNQGEERYKSVRWGIENAPRWSNTAMSLILASKLS
jgi:hypothetical protein